MKLAKLLPIGVLLAVSTVLAFDVAETARRGETGYKQTVPMPVFDESKIPDNPYGELVRYGKELFVHTYKYIGPEVKNPEMRYAGNNLSCQSCHLDAGAKPFASPIVGVYAKFPQYRPRENAIGTMEDRINGCMQRSMNGYPLPGNSREMKAFLAYFHWMSQSVPVGAKVEGTSLTKVDRKIINTKKADPVSGAKVYETHCAACHMPDGQGVKNAPNADGTPAGYQFPPLWGEDSYNSGAGMYRQIKATDFIYANMPLGATAENPILTGQEAYDVAAYINAYDKYRPQKINRDRDFPDLLVKAADADYGEYLDNVNAPQYKNGPYGKIIIAPKKK